MALDDAVLLKLKSQDLGARPQAIQDQDPDDSDSGEAQALALPPMPLLVRPPEDPPVQSIVPGFTHLKVLFDRYTHDSGNQRAFISCGEHDHNCRRYVFVKDFPSKQDVVAYLLAWRMAARNFPDRLQRGPHIAHVPPDDTINLVLRQQFG